MEGERKVQAQEKTEQKALVWMSRCLGKYRPGTFSTSSLTCKHKEQTDDPSLRGSVTRSYDFMYQPTSVKIQ